MKDWWAIVTLVIGVLSGCEVGQARQAIHARREFLQLCRGGELYLDNDYRAETSDVHAVGCKRIAAELWP